MGEGERRRGGEGRGGVEERLEKLKSKAFGTKAVQPRSVEGRRRRGEEERGGGGGRGEGKGGEERGEAERKMRRRRQRRRGPMEPQGPYGVPKIIISYSSPAEVFATLFRGQAQLKTKEGVFLDINEVQ